VELGKRERPEHINFRGFVKDCAQEPEFVDYFNRACGANLRAPITCLLNDSWPQEASDEEQMAIACFIVFVYENIWMRLKTAGERTGYRIESDLGAAEAAR
jgi:hypothetical protein